MEPEENVQTPELAIVPEVVPAVKKVKAPKVALRTIEELHNVTAKSMTDAEKNKYIEELRDQIVGLTNKASLLEGNCKSAYEQFRITRQQFDEYRMRAQAKLQYVKQAIGFCNTSVILNGNLDQE
jgi:hypothetical protein